MKEFDSTRLIQVGVQRCQMYLYVILIKHDVFIIIWGAYILMPRSRKMVFSKNQHFWSYLAHIDCRDYQYTVLIRCKTNLAAAACSHTFQLFYVITDQRSAALSLCRQTSRQLLSSHVSTSGLYRERPPGIIIKKESLREHDSFIPRTTTKVDCLNIPLKPTFETSPTVDADPNVFMEISSQSRSKSGNAFSKRRFLLFVRCRYWKVRVWHKTTGGTDIKCIWQKYTKYRW